ncbi:hypothetical protein SK3146_03824 [Paenibacillus konkukensis]|uniref:Uncharacterized protein n=1 Tax=Paenibacillus konkukensis TaxID=2020716 RepID=A0ABY4RT53_9BACL|nr:hypothetical protein [Paenibacillus konkukensis]UQZ84569.1 hypothetical protein SK3146_03824 [Paenibacillus konkukensis]
MTVTLKEKRELNNFLDLLAFSTVKRFYPTAAMNYTQVTSLEDTYDYFLDLVESGELSIVWEVKCTSEKIICARKLDDAQSKEMLLNKEVACDICGHEFTVSSNDLFPAFEISTEYREIVREDKKKTSNRLKINRHFAKV